MKMRSKVAAVMVVAAALVVGSGVLQAQATTTTTTGTLNCGGYNVHYSSLRYKQLAGEFYYHLTNQTGSTYGVDGTALGVTIHPSGSGAFDLSKHWMYLPQSPDADLGGSAYVVGTAFTLWGSMYASDGACDNYFAGTLSY